MPLNCKSTNNHKYHQQLHFLVWLAAKDCHNSPNVNYLRKSSEWKRILINCFASYNSWDFFSFHTFIALIKVLFCMRSVWSCVRISRLCVYLYHLTMSHRKININSCELNSSFFGEINIWVIISVWTLKHQYKGVIFQNYSDLPKHSFVRFTTEFVHWY